MKVQKKMSNQKAKFFAQYWGQEILWSNKGQVNPFEICHTWLTHNIKSSYIELIPLSQITDEDIDVIDMPYISIKDHLLNDIISQFEADYLRSKGYALPWMGISVEEQIKLGWIKLKDNE